MVIRQMERGAMGYIHFQTPISNIKGGLFHTFSPWFPRADSLSGSQHHSIRSDGCETDASLYFAISWAADGSLALQNAKAFGVIVLIRLDDQN
jgi:hypothetical protein